MKIVIDTNVLISGIFFGGPPGKVLNAVVDKKISAYATVEIVDEYQEIVREMVKRKQGHLNSSLLAPLIQTMQIIVPHSHIEICRDPDDNKFLSCAIDSKSLYIVSGDRDLLVLEKYKDITIVTAKDFCEKYLK